MNLMQLMSIIVMLCVVGLVSAAVADATQDFRDDQTSNSYAYNASNNGLKGISNASDYFDNIGTFAGIAALLGVIYLLFTGFRTMG